MHRTALARQVLLDAKCSDSEQMITFLRMLDKDCDGTPTSLHELTARLPSSAAVPDASCVGRAWAGLLSEKDFCHSMSHCHTPWWRAATLMQSEQRWHAAAVNLEKGAAKNAAMFIAALQKR